MFEKNRLKAHVELEIESAKEARDELWSTFDCTSTTRTCTVYTVEDVVSLPDRSKLSLHDVLHTWHSVSYLSNTCTAMSFHTRAIIDMFHVALKNFTVCVVFHPGFLESNNHRICVRMFFF